MRLGFLFLVLVGLNYRALGIEFVGRWSGGYGVIKSSLCIVEEFMTVVAI